MHKTKTKNCIASTTLFSLYFHTFFVIFLSLFVSQSSFARTPKFNFWTFLSLYERRDRRNPNGGNFFLCNTFYLFSL